MMDWVQFHLQHKVAKLHVSLTKVIINCSKLYLVGFKRGRPYAEDVRKLCSHCASKSHHTEKTARHGIRITFIFLRWGTTVISLFLFSTLVTVMSCNWTPFRRSGCLLGSLQRALGALNSTIGGTLFSDYPSHVLLSENSDHYTNYKEKLVSWSFNLETCL